MSDEQLRALERAAAAGDPEARAAWLHALARSRPRDARPGFTQVWLDRQRQRLLVRIAVVGACDSKRCPAHDAICHLHKAVGPNVRSPNHRGQLVSVATEGDRTLSFEWRRPDLDRDGLEVGVTVLGVSGASFFRSTRRLAVHGAAGVVFAPSLVEGYEDQTVEAWQELEEHLADQGLELGQTPRAVLWLSGSGRPETTAEAVGLEVPSGTPELHANRATGEGVAPALEVVLAGVLDAFDGGRFRDAGPFPDPPTPRQAAPRPPEDGGLLSAFLRWARSRP